MISASLSLSLPRAGWKSTSTPRSLKICTAADERASEMRTLGMTASRCLGQCGFGFRESPIQPRGQRLDVATLHCRATPAAQAGRCSPAEGATVGDASLFEQTGQGLGERRLVIAGEPRNRRVDDLQADRGIGAPCVIFCEVIDPRRDGNPVV